MRNYFLLGRIVFRVGFYKCLFVVAPELRELLGLEGSFNVAREGYLAG